MAVIGDIRRFPSVKHFVSFCGLATRKNQTGVADRAGQPISKSGNRRLRHYLFLAGDVARRVDPQLAATYARHTGRGTHHTEALVVVAAALARRVYAVLRRQAMADPTPSPGGDEEQDKVSYAFRTDEGERLTAREAARHTRERFPSKAARRHAEAEAKSKAKGGARAPTAREEGQPAGSPTGVADTRLRSTDNQLPHAGP